MQLRILQILEKNRFNTGSVHQMFQAAEGLAERGHDVTIVSRPGPELEERTRAVGLRFLSFPFLHELDLGTIRGFKRAITELEPDVIHVHKGLSHTLALAATWRTRVPAFVVNRGVSFPLTLWNRAKYRTRRVDRIIAVCQRIREIVCRTGRVAPERVEVVYSGTDTRRFDPGLWPRESFRAELAIPPESFLFMQVGVRDWKGWRELVEAFAILADRVPDARLALVACRNDAEHRMVREYAGLQGVGDRVIPVEYRTDMPNVLAAADCIVDASWSGTGITGTIREGMAMGRRVVATDCGGNRELVASPGVGWLVPPRNRKALVEALADAAAMPAERADEVGRAARARVVESFSRDTKIDRLERIYTALVRQKSPA